MKKINYEYHNAPIPGGGYVTGYVYSQSVPGLLFARTDIGGVYRFSTKEQRWESLIDHVTMERLDETYPAAIALDENRPGRLYIACGTDGREEGVLAVSDDYGDSFCYRRIPVAVHGNLNGRGTGYRLVVHPEKPDTLYFASQRGGLLISRDAGETWEVRTVCRETYLTFVWVSGKKEGMLVVGTAGVATGLLPVPENKYPMRGTTLYVSYDDGQSFRPMEQPENHFLPPSRWSGYVAQRYAEDDHFLYVTLGQTGATSYVVEMGYSCDSGDALGGRVLRYRFAEDGSLGGYEDITPPAENDSYGTSLPYAFSGICASQKKPGFLVLTTICRQGGDCVYRSYDYGATWETILYDLAIGTLQFRTSYMRPEYNGGHSLLHWLSDIKINPFAPEEAWFNSGTGAFRTTQLLSENVVFSDWCDGIEETVHLNVYSPNAGPVKVIDLVGDLGGFAFRDLTRPCRNSFDDENGNRYITCINADYSELFPERFVVTARGNWTGKTKGGLIVTEDAGESFTRLPMPYGLSARLDELLHRIEQPNVNAGWVAMSPDCRTIVWTVAEWTELPAECVIYSRDAGRHFARSKVYDSCGKAVTGSGLGAQPCLKVMSDRMDSSVFYGFGEAGQFYVSTDGGANFFQKRLPEEFPAVHFGKIDCADKTELRGDAGRRGSFYLALGDHGLWKLRYEKQTDTVTVTRLSREKDAVYRVGLGLRAPGAGYLAEDKAVYFCGIIDGVYGFYRSFDDARTLERLNTEQQMFGEILSIDGDSRCFGRFYLATGSRGLIYGEEEKNQTKEVTK